MKFRRLLQITSLLVLFLCPCQGDSQLIVGNGYLSSKDTAFESYDASNVIQMSFTMKDVDCTLESVTFWMTYPLYGEPRLYLCKDDNQDQPQRPSWYTLQNPEERTFVREPATFRTAANVILKAKKKYWLVLRATHDTDICVSHGPAVGNAATLGRNRTYQDTMRVSKECPVFSLLGIPKVRKSPLPSRSPSHSPARSRSPIRSPVRSCSPSRSPISSRSPSPSPISSRRPSRSPIRTHIISHSLIHSFSLSQQFNFSSPSPSPSPSDSESPSPSLHPGSSPSPKSAPSTPPESSPSLEPSSSSEPLTSPEPSAESDSSSSPGENAGGEASPSPNAAGQEGGGIAQVGFKMGDKPYTLVQAKFIVTCKKTSGLEVHLYEVNDKGELGAEVDTFDVPQDADFDKSVVTFKAKTKPTLKAGQKYRLVFKTKADKVELLNIESVELPKTDGLKVFIENTKDLFPKFILEGKPEASPSPSPSPSDSESPSPSPSPRPSSSPKSASPSPSPSPSESPSASPRYSPSPSSKLEPLVSPAPSAEVEPIPSPSPGEEDRSEGSLTMAEFLSLTFIKTEKTCNLVQVKFIMSETKADKFELHLYEHDGEGHLGKEVATFDGPQDAEYDKKVITFRPQKEVTLQAGQWYALYFKIPTGTVTLWTTPFVKIPRTDGLDVLFEHLSQLPDVLIEGKCQASPSPSPSPSESESPSPSPHPSLSPSPRSAPSMSPEPSASLEPSSSPEPSASLEPSSEAESSLSPAPSASPEPSASLEPSTSLEPSASSEPLESPEPLTSVEPSPSPDEYFPSRRVQPNRRSAQELQGTENLTVLHLAVVYFGVITSLVIGIVHWFPSTQRMTISPAIYDEP